MKASAVVAVRAKRSFLCSKETKSNEAIALV